MISSGMNGNPAWKNFMAGNLYQSGLFRLTRTICRNRVTIVGYHRFASSVSPPGALSARLFEEHLQYLKRYFTCISFREMSYLLQGKLHVRNPLILSVDDGHRDFVKVALPLLKKYDIPATLFVTTQFVDGNIWLWPDIINHVVFRTEKEEIRGFNSERNLSLRTPAERRAARDIFQDIGKRMNEADKCEFLQELADRLKVRVPPTPPEEFQAVSWKDLREPGNSLIEIGSHTLTHPILSRISSEEAEKEIRRSKQRIEQELDREVVAFSYPNGYSLDYTEHNKEAIKRSGYSYAVTCDFGHNPFDADPFQLKRIVAQNDTARFAKQVSGFEHIQRRTLGFRPSSSHDAAGHYVR